MEVVHLSRLELGVEGKVVEVDVPAHCTHLQFSLSHGSSSLPHSTTPPLRSVYLHNSQQSSDENKRRRKFPLDMLRSNFHDPLLHHTLGYRHEPMPKNVLTPYLEGFLRRWTSAFRSGAEELCHGIRVSVQAPASLSARASSEIRSDNRTSRCDCTCS